MNQKADATPSKRFFIGMLTRDIVLEDAVLDLIDNAIDPVTRVRESEPKKMLERLLSSATNKNNFPTINISINEDEFKMTDTCGGIDIRDAQKEVFRFGYTSEVKHSFLSVYGIGLKRAFFKLGKDVLIKSQTLDNGFEVKFNVDEWEKQKEWKFPLQEIDKVDRREEAGTTILVRNLNKDVVVKIRAGEFAKRLYDKIATAYTYFLEKDIKVFLNDTLVEPIIIPFGISADTPPAYDGFDVDGVYVQIFAGLADRSKGEWKQENAGWYILCNGRMVSYADKTDVTGWGRNYANFVPKYRGFIGIVFFISTQPELLPWRTTKRSLNEDSYVYQRTLNKMGILAKPIIDFLNKMYASEEYEMSSMREIAKNIGTADLIEVSEKGYTSFTVAKEKITRKPKTKVRVQFNANISDIEKIKKRLKKDWSASRIGEYALKYFIRQECS